MQILHLLHSPCPSVPLSIHRQVRLSPYMSHENRLTKFHGIFILKSFTRIWRQKLSNFGYQTTIRNTKTSMLFWASDWVGIPWAFTNVKGQIPKRNGKNSKRTFPNNFPSSSFFLPYFLHTSSRVHSSALYIYSVNSLPWIFSTCYIVTGLPLSRLILGRRALNVSLKFVR